MIYIILIIVIALALIFVFALLKAGSDADDIIEKLINDENDSLKIKNDTIKS